MFPPYWQLLSSDIIINIWRGGCSFFQVCEVSGCRKVGCLQTQNSFVTLSLYVPVSKDKGKNKDRRRGGNKMWDLEVWAEEMVSGGGDLQTHLFVPSCRRSLLKSEALSSFYWVSFCPHPSLKPRCCSELYPQIWGLV